MLEAAIPPPPATSCPRPASDPRWSLLVAVLGSTMAFVDGSVINVALPVMQRDLRASVGQMQWVVEAYALVLAALVLVGGATGDRLGRRWVFVAGVLIFAAASGACALASGPSFLVAARVIQGAGAALLVPGSLALIGAAYRGEARGAAIGTWSSATSAAAAAGPLLGGFLVAHASWRWLFVINLPLAGAVAAIATAHVAETRDTDAPAAVDVAGALLAMLGLGAVTWALLEAPVQGGLAAPRTLAVLAGGVAVLAAFPFVERRARAPMVPLGLFRSRTFTGANLATLFLYAALGACFFFLPFDLIQVERYSPPLAAAAMLPFVILIAALSPWSGAFVARRGPRLPLLVGPLVAALGFALLGTASRAGSYWTAFFPGITVVGLAMGITVAPLTTAVMGSVEARHAGVASGINNAVSRAAGLLAIAGLGALLVARFNRTLDVRLDDLMLSPATRAFLDAERAKLAAAALPPGVDPPTGAAIRSAIDDAFVDGFHLLMKVDAGLGVLAAAASALVFGGLRAGGDGEADTGADRSPRRRSPR